MKGMRMDARAIAGSISGRAACRPTHGPIVTLARHKAKVCMSAVQAFVDGEYMEFRRLLEKADQYRIPRGYAVDDLTDTLRERVYLGRHKMCMSDADIALDMLSDVRFTVGLLHNLEG